MTRYFYADVIGDVSPGLFPNERIVQMVTICGTMTMSMLSDNINQSRVRVVVIEQNSERSLIQIPTREYVTFAVVPNTALLPVTDET